MGCGACSVRAVETGTERSLGEQEWPTVAGRVGEHRLSGFTGRIRRPPIVSAWQRRANPLGIAGSWYPTPGHLAGGRGAVTPKTLGPLPSSATGDDESHGSLTPSDRFHRRRPVGGSATSGVWWAVERPALDARAHDRSVFWAIVGGIGASLLLPAMQSLIHGELRRRDAEEGLRPRRRGGGDRATVGPLLGGFITTFPGGWASRSRLLSSPWSCPGSASCEMCPTRGTGGTRWACSSRSRVWAASSSVCWCDTRVASASGRSCSSVWPRWWAWRCG
jgi:hypothetical protein